ncbi:MAG: hypothetical protein AMXMBFR44_1610 [Candidatus Campbellbacteria bacterium]
MQEILRSVWVFVVLAAGLALVAWLLMERFLPTDWYYLLEVKGKRIFLVLWATFILARLAFPGAEPAFFWAAVACCALVVAVVVLSVVTAWIGEVVQRHKEKKQQRLKLKRQTCS